VRHQLGKDRKGTLKAIKEMGYVQVEPYEFPKYKALVEDAKELGLKVNSTHIQWNSVLNPGAAATPAFAKVLEEAQAAGIKHLIIPTIDLKDRQTLDGYKLTAEKMNRAAAEAKTAGIQLAYHNHTFEFDPMEGGKAGYDLQMEEFSADMLFEVDAFWVQLGKRDPAKLIRTLKGRVTQVHLKDLSGGVKLPEMIEGWWGLPVEAFASLGDGITTTTFLPPMAGVSTLSLRAGRLMDGHGLALMLTAMESANPWASPRPTPSPRCQSNPSTRRTLPMSLMTSLSAANGLGITTPATRTGRSR
jgi:sugar phosphate isomerase/epimerase